MRPSKPLRSAVYASAVQMPPRIRSTASWPALCWAKSWPARCTTMQGDSIRVTLLVTAVFQRLGIPYAVGGSLSSSVHGVMRSTLDVDILADMRMEHIQPFVAALSAEFYADDEMIAGAIAH